MYVLFCKMDSERHRQERLSHRRDLIKLSMARETFEEREARLIRQHDYMHKRRANERQSTATASPTCGSREPYEFTTWHFYNPCGIKRNTTTIHSMYVLLCNSPITRDHEHVIPIEDIHPYQMIFSGQKRCSVSNSLECVNILLLQSVGQHQKVMLCQVIQLQDKCFPRLDPRCFNICLVYGSCSRYW